MYINIAENIVISALNYLLILTEKVMLIIYKYIIIVAKIIETFAIMEYFRLFARLAHPRCCAQSRHLPASYPSNLRVAGMLSARRLTKQTVVRHLLRSHLRRRHT